MTLDHIELQVGRNLARLAVSQAVLADNEGHNEVDYESVFDDVLTDVRRHHSSLRSGLHVDLLTLVYIAVRALEFPRGGFSELVTSSAEAVTKLNALGSTLPATANELLLDAVRFDDRLDFIEHCLDAVGSKNPDKSDHQMRSAFIAAVAAFTLVLDQHTRPSSVASRWTVLAQLIDLAEPRPAPSPPCR